VQYAFSLERHWRSDIAPQMQMRVDVVLSPIDEVREVHAVSKAELNQELLHARVEDVRAIATQTLGPVVRAGLSALKSAVATVGSVNLVTLAVLMTGWFGFNTVSIRLTSATTTGLTFYDLLCAIHSLDSIYALADIKQGGAGLYGSIAYLTLAACVAPSFYPRKSLWLGLAAPLAYMCAVFAGVYWKISSTIASMTSAVGSDAFAHMANGFASEMAGELLKAISFGAGAYVSFAAALFLAYRGISRYSAS
jgi:hypothetical protein